MTILENQDTQFYQEVQIIQDREFFVSLYYRDPNQLLIEIATGEGNLDAKAYENQSPRFEEIPLFLPQYLNFIREQVEQ